MLSRKLGPLREYIQSASHCQQRFPTAIYGQLRRGDRADRQSFCARSRQFFADD
jgi:hypothetical protein